MPQRTRKQSVWHRDLISPQTRPLANKLHKFILLPTFACIAGYLVFRTAQLFLTWANPPADLPTDKQVGFIDMLLGCAILLALTCLFAAEPLQAFFRWHRQRKAKQHHPAVQTLQPPPEAKH